MKCVLALVVFSTIPLLSNARADPACNDFWLAACGANAVAVGAATPALPLVKLAKDHGAFRDLGECEEVARDAGRLGNIIGPAGSSILAGKCGECVCRLAY